MGVRVVWAESQGLPEPRGGFLAAAEAQKGLAPDHVRTGILGDQARRLGVGTAAVLAAIDLVYVPARRISKMYLVDAALEVGWILAWYRVDKPAQGE